MLYGISTHCLLTLVIAIFIIPFFFQPRALIQAMMRFTALALAQLTLILFSPPKLCIFCCAVAPFGTQDPAVAACLLVQTFVHVLKMTAFAGTNHRLPFFVLQFSFPPPVDSNSCD